VAVISGGGGELGRALAAAFLEAEARVALLDIPPAISEARRLARTLAPAALAIATDVTREAQVRRAFAQVRGRWGQLDFVINNAGVEGPTAPVEKIRRRDWDQTLAANLTGAFLCAREAAHGWKRQPTARGGCLIQIGSVAGRIAYPLRLPYAASKAALEALTRTLAVELGPHSIRVNLVAPGPIAGARMERIIRRRARALGESPARVRAGYLRATSLGRMVTYEEVAKLVLYLCSPAAAGITGQTIEASAGWVAGSV